MNMQDIGALLDYHYWARDVLLEAVGRLDQGQFTRRIESSFASVRDTLVHIYGAELVWYRRWTGDAAPALPRADAFPDVESIRRAWSQLEADVRALVERLGENGLARRFEYKSLTGEPASASLWQMIQHVVNHGSYHRGQVTTMLRQLGADPPRSMDLIRFYRRSLV